MLPRPLTAVQLDTPLAVVQDHLSSRRKIRVKVQPDDSITTIFATAVIGLAAAGLTPRAAAFATQFTTRTIMLPLETS